MNTNFFTNILMAVVTFGYYPMIETGTHHNMTEISECPIKSNAFGEFKKEFNKTDWILNQAHKKSLFTKDVKDYPNYQCHADIFSINGI